MLVLKLANYSVKSTQNPQSFARETALKATSGFLNSIPYRWQFKGVAELRCLNIQHPVINIHS